MRAAILLPLVALAAAQAPPAPVLLTVTKSGVIPVAPTPFNGVETLEGAIIDDGGVMAGITGQYGNATIQQNAAGVTFQAVLPSTNFDPLTGSTITGYLNATVPSNGTGVMITVHFEGLPSVSEYGPFVYHIHALPVPADGNCTSTLGHLDVTNRGELYACDPTQPQTCQTGDLAGKHGNITSKTFDAKYSEFYLSTNPTNSYYFGNGSIVIHSSNATRLTCANLTLVSAGTANYNYSSSAINGVGGGAASSTAASGSAASSGAASTTNSGSGSATSSGAMTSAAAGGSSGTMMMTSTGTIHGVSTSGINAGSTTAHTGAAMMPTGAVGSMFGAAALIVGGMAMI